MNKVYVTGTQDRLFVSKNYDNNQWLLVDNRGNVYESSNSADAITEHIDNFVKQGKYTVK
jgi:hypothetical protein